MLLQISGLKILQARINGILHKLKYIYPQNILITLYKSLFVPHINYGSLLWGHAGGTLDKKKC